MIRKKNISTKQWSFHDSFDDFLQKNFMLVALFFLMSTLIIILSGEFMSGNLSGTSRASTPVQDIKSALFKNNEDVPVCNRDKIWKWWCGDSKEECLYCRKVVNTSGVSYVLESCSDSSQLGKGYLLQCGFTSGQPTENNPTPQAEPTFPLPSETPLIGIE
jgi:hypothetical protein